MFIHAQNIEKNADFLGLDNFRYVYISNNNNKVKGRHRVQADANSLFLIHPINIF